ncbi:MAG TPA: serine/threonine-protein kinase, partial [Methylomirabilota bacterium]|nr:serine/threonine-protein kinase [Methylomirabilota bacterium]
MNNPSIPKRYAVRCLLGEGGSSRVYRVQDSIRDRELALKLVTAAESAFLRREFDTLRQIRHENLIQVFDWGALPSGEAYYTMELIEGGDWSGRMGKAQPADDVRHILTGLLRGLAHLHCHGEIHGDLKPANILLGAGGVVKITDVGMGGSGRSASGLSGTPGYAAPEVWEGSRADVRSDLYSVGVMTYEALTGKHPFAGRTVREVISGQLEGWVPSPGVHGRQVPADLERVVMRAVERKPGLRQGSADEFMEGFGVEDRIGEILGGKLVGREKEIAEIEKLLYSEEPGTPTLLYVTGEPGIGKTALLNEIAHRLLNAAARVVDLDFSIRVSPEEQLSTSLELSATSDLPKLLLDLGNDSPLLIHARLRNLDDPASESFCRSLARYVWALSMEVGRASHILFALRGSKTEHPDRFEQVIRVSPLSGTHFGGALRYFLGAEDLKSELVAKLMSLTGGNPGMLRSALVSLIDRRLLDRRDGIWRFREATQIQSLSIEPESNPWFPA